MKTELFAKLPSVTLHCLKVTVLGQEPKWFKSKDCSKLEKKLRSIDYYDYEIKSFEVKDTLEVDENHELCGLKSIRGEML